ncbi:MAG: hypothetical protein NC131_06135 [Roseburia sp.]|nr:hypothetical protein [Roseburia sp.]
MKGRSGLAMMATLLAAAAIQNNHFSGGTNYPVNERPKTTPKSHKPIEKPMREFSIKGHKVMAYSRKDAITRLKHLKLIKKK